MPLIDDIEFYGSRVDAGDIDRDHAAQLLANASQGLLTARGARQCIDTWEGYRASQAAVHADVTDILRAVDNGRPVPEHVYRNARTRYRDRMLRRLRNEEADL